MTSDLWEVRPLPGGLSLEKGGAAVTRASPQLGQGEAYQVGGRSIKDILRSCSGKSQNGRPGSPCTPLTEAISPA